MSTRAAAESAARAGFPVTSIDAFGDLDQHPSVRALSLARDLGQPITALSTARASRSIDCDAVVYLSNLDNHSRAVRSLAANRALWGNPPGTLRRVRDPFLVAETLARLGLAAPIVERGPHDAPRSGERPGEGTPAAASARLVKPWASGGGHRVRAWRPGTPVPRGYYLQARVPGPPGSIVFAAAGGRAVPLGVSRQLIGERAFGATGYRYCGSILAAAGDRQFADDESLFQGACTLARAIADAFGLVGVNGIDFIANGGVPYAIEVNPRWCASMELAERAYGLSVFRAHAAACEEGVLPAFDLGQARRNVAAIGKGVVYARRDVVVGDSRAWLADPTIRDVPHPGERIRAGRPVCTVFAEGEDAGACHAGLVGRAERVYAELARWERDVA